MAKSTSPTFCASAPSYPTDLHASHNDYPLAPEHMTVTRDMLSYYNKDVNTRTFAKQDCLRKAKLESAEFKTFKSTNHVVKTVTIKKIGLSPYDTKRYILPDGISTLAYGHYKIAG